MPPKRKAAAAPAPAPATKRGKGKGAAKKAAAACDPDAFAAVLLETCKVLMTVVETVMIDDPTELTVTTQENFGTHGQQLLELLPEEARLTMMKMVRIRHTHAAHTQACVGARLPGHHRVPPLIACAPARPSLQALSYQEELERYPPLMIDQLLGVADEADAEEEASSSKSAAAKGKKGKKGKKEPEPPPAKEEEEDDDLGEDELMRAEHFYHFKSYFTEAEAAAFVAAAPGEMEVGRGRVLARPPFPTPAAKQDGEPAASQPPPGVVSCLVLRRRRR